MRLGDYQLDLLHDGLWKLDGGAMFGIVPKPLWSREAPADERNRIPLSCRCPLIRAGKEIILIDNGLGRKWTDKQREIYAIPPEETLLTQLASVGLKPSDITMMVLTHLHLDHAGWNTRLNAKGELDPVFVNARHIVERRELETARRPNEIQRGTYLPPNIEPIEKGMGFEVFDDLKEIVPGITLFRTGGHTLGNFQVRMERGDDRALFIGEMMPTVAHRHLPWVMAYDNYPMETLVQKKTLLKECVQKQSLVLLDHDPVHAAVKLRELDGGKLEVVPIA